MEEITFAERVYAICKSIPQSKVTTYGEIAKALGTKGYQAIGQALRCNPYAPIVPCHRVVKVDGSLGGFKGQRSGKEIKEKIALLKSEGVRFYNDKINLAAYGFQFSR